MPISLIPAIKSPRVWNIPLITPLTIDIPKFCTEDINLGILASADSAIPSMKLIIRSQPASIISGKASPQAVSMAAIISPAKDITSPMLAEIPSNRDMIISKPV